MGASTRRFFANRQATVIGLLFLLLALAVLARGQAGARERSYDLRSRESQGLLALRLWLLEMGYQVETTGRERPACPEDGQCRFALPAGTDLLFIYPNQEPFSQSEAADLATWVRSGHTVVLVGLQGNDRALADTFGVRTVLVGAASPTASQGQPLLPEAPDTLAQLDLVSFLQLADAPQAVPVLLDSTGRPVVSVQSFGQGTVWHLSSRYSLVNANLQESQEPLLVPALLRHVPPGGTVVFDTYHLFGPSLEGRLGEIATLQDWVYRTAAGQATLYTLLVLGAYLLLQGVRLGPPLPLVSEARRREAAEFVVAMAGLQRRARQRDAVAHYHKQRLKARLGRSVHANPEWPDDRFLHHLAAMEDRWSAEDLAKIRDLLDTLSGVPDDARLVETVARVDGILNAR